MENRYKLPKDAQVQYFQDIEFVSGLHGDTLASFFGVVGRSYRDWKRGKFSIPQKTVALVENHFHVHFPASKQMARKQWKKSKQEASRQGGLALFRKHGSPATAEGRKKGGLRALAILRERGIIPKQKPFYHPKTYSKELAELVGILLGDGHIGKSQWFITLNDTADQLYTFYVIDLVKNLFSFVPSVLHRKEIHVRVIYGGGLKSIEYFQNIGLHVGNKVIQQVGVPLWIMQNQEFAHACLRGLIDTDGGIFKHKYTVNKKQYVYTKLCFSNRSIPLLQFVYRTLQNLGFTPKIIDKVENKKVWLYNQTEVKEYINQVGTSNPRLLVNLGG